MAELEPAEELAFRGRWVSARACNRTSSSRCNRVKPAVVAEIWGTRWVEEGSQRFRVEVRDKEDRVSNRKHRSRVRNRVVSNNSSSNSRAV